MTPTVRSLEIADLYPNQFILPCAQTDLLGIGELNAPVHLRIEGPELILSIFPILRKFRGMVSRLLVHQINGGLIDCHGVFRGKDSNIIHDGGVRISTTITGRGDLSEEVEIERLSFFIMDGSIGIFHHFFLEEGDGLIPLDLDRAGGTGEDTFSTPHTFFGIDRSHR
jgi:hypothetical protein